jgi:transcriptional regulator with XRE-family HTH domain
VHKTTGVGLGQLSDLESGRVNLTVETLAKVALALGTPMAELVNVDLAKVMAKALAPFTERS